MTPERLDDLASRLSEAGDLSPEEERELGLALQESPEARRVVMSYFRLEGALLEQARAGLLLGTSPARQPAPLRPFPARRPSTLAWSSGLAAAGILLALLFFAQGPLTPATAPLQARASGPSRSPHSASSAIPPEPSSAPNPALSRVPEEDPAFPSPTPALEKLLSPRELETPTSKPLPSSSETPSGTPLDNEGKKLQDSVLTEILIERVEGDVKLVGAGGKVPGQAGDSVRGGQGLETGGGKSLAVLSFPDGTRIEARADTLLRDIREKGAAPGKAGRSLYLQHGSVWAQVRPQPADRPLVIQSPRGEARVLGTVFTLRMDPDPKGVLRLDVQEGRVRFTRSSDGRTIEVGAAHSVSSGQSADLVAIRSQDEIQSFQDGRFPAADYAGTRDTELVEKSPQTAFGGAKVLLAEAEDPKEKRKASWPLLRWDLSSVPVGSKVHSVSVGLHIVEPSRGQAFYFFEPARSWIESEATWKLASAGNLWRFPGSLGSAERWPTALGTLTPLQKGEYTTMLGDAGIAVVQSWINIPATNLGLQIAGSSAAAGFHFSSREAPSPETRPRLTIVYTPRK
jgi:ferric-dicitrate binding protein FerR (iron transport regulator)